MAKDIKFRVHLPYECLFDLRWGFIRKYSGLSDLELFPRFNMFCSRLTDTLPKLFPNLTKEFKVNADVVKLAPRTAIITTVTNAFREYSADRPDDVLTLHITVDFAIAPFITNDIRTMITEALKESLVHTGNKVHATHVCTGYSGYAIKDLRKKFDALIVDNLMDFMEVYNPKTREAYSGLGIITRPVFLDGKSPERFHQMIAESDRRHPGNGSRVDGSNDHYDILSDAFAHLGPIYFHEPEFFSAMLPK